MPLNGLSSFLQAEELPQEAEELCVNALKRAFFISTVPSQTPVFMRLPGPVSAGNSQNILNMHTFSHIFGAG